MKKRARPATARPENGKPYIAPRNPLEELIANRWRDMFGLQQISINDNFFELGGNSIRAAMFLNQLQRDLGEFVYAVALFDAPTVAELAAYLDKRYANALARLLGPQALEGTRPAQHANG